MSICLRRFLKKIGIVGDMIGNIKTNVTILPDRTFMNYTMKLKNKATFGA